MNRAKLDGQFVSEAGHQKLEWFYIAPNPLGRAGSGDLPLAPG